MPRMKDRIVSLDRPIHRDDKGLPCTQHVPDPNVLMVFAALGERTASFHHDVASKLQRLVFALDELEELGASDPDVQRIALSSSVVLRELQQLFMAQRELSRPLDRVRVPLRAILQRVVRECGAAEIEPLAASADVELEASVPSLAHALEIVIELCAASGYRGRSDRTVALSVSTTATHAVVTIARPDGIAAPESSGLAESLAVAAFEVARDGGELRCHGDTRFEIHLALDAQST